MVMRKQLESRAGDEVVALKSHSNARCSVESRFKCDYISLSQHIFTAWHQVRRFRMAQTDSMPDMMRKKMTAELVLSAAWLTR